MITSKSLPEQKINVHVGEQLILYSDGIIDQFDKDDKRKMGSKGLRALFEELTKPTNIQEFESQFESFKGETKALDDQTLLLLTVWQFKENLFKVVRIQFHIIKCNWRDCFLIDGVSQKIVVTNTKN